MKEDKEGLDPILFTTPSEYVQDQLDEIEAVKNEIKKILEPITDLTDEDFITLGIEYIKCFKGDAVPIYLVIKFTNNEEEKYLYGESIEIAINEMVRIINEDKEGFSDLL